MIVVDCSALVDALTGVDGSEQLRVRFAREELHAPSLIDYETVSVLRALTLRGHLSPARATDLLADFDDLPLHRWPSTDALRRRTFQLRDKVSAYDATYVALAEALACPLVTRDARLARAVGHDAHIELR